MVRAVHKLFKLTPHLAVKRLPKPYLDYLEKSQEPPERVHDEPPETKYLDYNQDYQTGYVYRVPDQPIPIVRTAKSETGLWGGLGMVEGFHKPKRLKPRHTRIWFPSVIERHTFYSDILDVHINIDVTERTLELIDKHEGFDFYILKTPVQDLVSEFGRRLKHKMLIALATDTRDYVKEKYKDYVQPLDEVSWHGLKTTEAITKFKLMGVEETIAPPLKVIYANQLIEKLKKSSQVESQEATT